MNNMDDKKINELTPEELANLVKSVDDNRLDADEKILGGTGVSIEEHISDEELIDKLIYRPVISGEESKDSEEKSLPSKEKPRFTKSPLDKVKAKNRAKNKQARNSRKKNRKK